MDSKNIFVIGLNDFNLGELKSIDEAEKYNFIRVFNKKELQVKYEKPDLEMFLDKAREEITGFGGDIDGIIGFFDFPVTLLAFVLANEFKTRAPSLESAFKCEHKYWSRVEQKKVISENIPKFSSINPFDPPGFDSIELKKPFWIKPVKSYASQLGFKIENQDDFESCLEEIREDIHKFADPFNYLLSFIEMPEDLSDVDGNFCIAEELVEGHQCTLSGYVYHGEVRNYGIVDSINYEEAPSFFYYLFPSNLPESVQERMRAISEKVMKQIGFDNSPFNIEFFYDEESDQINLLEINPRMSQSHSDLYAKVKGSSNHEVLVKCVTDQDPEFKDKKGKYQCAAKFHYRIFDKEDGIVKRVPSDEDLKEIRKEFPETIMNVEINKGNKLSELPIQDSYSFRLASIYTGAENEKALIEKYNKIVDKLNIKVE